MFEIKRYTADKADEWNRFVAESKNGTFLFDRRYMDYHADRFEDYSLMFYYGGSLLAVFPAHLSGDTLCSHKGLTYGGLLMSVKLTISQTMALFSEMNDYLRNMGVRHVYYKCIPWIYHRISSEEDLYALYHVCHARIVARDFSTNIFLTAGLRWERVRRRGSVRAQQAKISVERSDDYSAFWHALCSWWLLLFSCGEFGVQHRRCRRLKGRSGSVQFTSGFLHPLYCGARGMELAAAIAGER